MLRSRPSIRSLRNILFGISLVASWTTWIWITPLDYAFHPVGMANANHDDFTRLRLQHREARFAGLTHGCFGYD